MPLNPLKPDRFLNFLRRQSPAKLMVVVGLILIACAIADIQTGPGVAISIFYLIPISLACYFITDRFGLMVILVSAIMWYVANLEARQLFSSDAVHLWNGLTRLVMFLIVGGLVSAVRRAWQQQHELAHTDFLTGLPNRRYFSDWLQNEIHRAKRYEETFSVGYLDIDDFKILNDFLGHATGDVLLKEVAKVIREEVRKSDLAARIGGDEFAILFPETDSETVIDVVERLHQKLGDLVRARDWPVSFSIGVVTCPPPPLDVETILHMVDEVMYRAKRGGKDRVRHELLSIGEVELRDA